MATNPCLSHPEDTHRLQKRRLSSTLSFPRSARQVCACWSHHRNTTLIKPFSPKSCFETKPNHSPTNTPPCRAQGLRLQYHRAAQTPTGAPNALLHPRQSRSTAPQPNPDEKAWHPQDFLVLTAPLSSGAVSCPAAWRHGPSPSSRGWRAACSRRRAGAGV